MSIDTVELRWWQKVEQKGPDECWPWLASTNKHGKPQIRCGAKMANAIRVGYRIIKGELPNELNVCHTCDNGWCCNPRHWFLGTQVQNIQDMVDKGRSTKGKKRPATQGEKHHGAKLTNRQVERIREMYTGKRGDMTKIANKFGVSPSHVSNIIHGRGRSH